MLNTARFQLTVVLLTDFNICSLLSLQLTFFLSSLSSSSFLVFSCFCTSTVCVSDLVCLSVISLCGTMSKQKNNQTGEIMRSQSAICHLHKCLLNTFSDIHTYGPSSGPHNVCAVLRFSLNDLWQRLEQLWRYSCAIKVILDLILPFFTSSHWTDNVIEEKKS